MSTSSLIINLIASLESLYVKEFRGLQHLLNLTKEERVALTVFDHEKLVALIEHKETLIDELGCLESKREGLILDLVKATGADYTQGKLPEILAPLDPSATRHVTHLQEGITVLAGKIRELTPGNQALAAAAMERLDATQTFLLNLFQPPAGYHPAYVTPALQPAVTFDLDHQA